MYAEFMTIYFFFYNKVDSMAKNKGGSFKPGGVNKSSGLAKATSRSAGKAAKKGGGKSGKPTNTKRSETDNFWIRSGGEKQTTVDIYKGQIEGINPINSGSDKAGGGGFSNTFKIGGGSLGSFGGLLGSLKSAVNIASTAKGIFNGNGNFLDKIGGITGLSKSVLTNLNIPEDSDLFKQIVSGTNIVVQVAEHGRKLQNVDWGNLQSIAGVIAEYTGDNGLFKISDLGVEGQFAARLINEAVKNGIPDSFEKIAGAIGRSEVLKGVLGDILPTIISQSDLNNLKGVLDLLGSDEVKALFPGVVEEFSSLYKRQWWDDSSDKDRYKEFNSVMKQYDSEWWKTKRKDGKILSTEKIMHGSAVFKDVYYLGLQEETEKDMKLLAIFKVMRPTTVEGEIRKHFPRVLVRPNVVMAKDEDLIQFKGVRHG